MHGAKTSEKSCIGSRNKGRSILDATDTRFMAGSTNHVNIKENTAAMRAHSIYYNYIIFIYV